MLPINHIQDLLSLDIHDFEQVRDLKISPLSIPPSILESLDDNEFQHACYFIAQCLNLEYLDLQGINLGALESVSRLQPFCEAIGKCLKLKLLDFSRLNIGNLNLHCFQMTSRIIAQSLNLQSLALDWIPFYKLDFTGMQTIWNAIAKSPNLQILYLIGTHLDQLDTPQFQALCNAIQKCRNLKTLEFLQIEIVNLVPNHFDMLCSAISASPSLAYCDFKFIQTDFTEERHRTIEKILQKKQILLELSREKGHTSLVYMAAKVVAENLNLSTQNLPKEIQGEIDKYRSINASFRNKRSLEVK